MKISRLNALISIVHTADSFTSFSLNTYIFARHL